MAPRTRPDDDWGVGQMADGSINSMTEEAARIARAKRDVEEEVWNDHVEEDLDDVSDLDDDE